MFEDAKKAIEESSLESSVYVGCDSVRIQKNKVWYIRFCTVVVLHLDSSKGCKIFYNIRREREYAYNIRQRLLQEVMEATNTAYDLLEHIGPRKLEVHFDLNSSPKHKSNVAVKEALSYARSMLPNVPARIKPLAFAAAHCADHLVKGKKI